MLIIEKKEFKDYPKELRKGIKRDYAIVTGVTGGVVRARKKRVERSNVNGKNEMALKNKGAAMDVPNINLDVFDLRLDLRPFKGATLSESINNIRKQGSGNTVTHEILVPLHTLIE